MGILEEGASEQEAPSTPQRLVLELDGDTQREPGEKVRVGLS